MTPTLEDLPVPGIRHRFVELGATRLHVAEAGPQDGGEEPLLLLHGWPQHWYLWRRVIGALGTQRRLICPDLRGMGWSDAPAGGYAKEEMASEMLALLDRLGVARAGLIGHDWGGWLGFLMCMREEQRFSAFLALGIPPPFLGPSPRRALGLWRLWYQALLATPVLGARAVGSAQFHKLVLERGTGPGFEWEPEELEAFVAPLREPRRARASSALYRTFLMRELGPLVGGRYSHARLRVPTLLIAGEHDPVVRAQDLADGARRAENLRVEIVPGAGHFVVDERPELVIERARELFALHDAGA